MYLSMGLKTHAHWRSSNAILLLIFLTLDEFIQFLQIKTSIIRIKFDTKIVSNHLTNILNLTTKTKNVEKKKELATSNELNMRKRNKNKIYTLSPLSSMGS